VPSLNSSSPVTTLAKHTGTHVDAPFHYFPTCKGRPARTIDQMPLERFFNDGVVLDMRHKETGSIVTVEDHSYPYS
jgi:kynurenine formamidase